MKPDLVITEAGRRMLCNFLELEAGLAPKGRWPEVYSTRMVDVLVDGAPAKGMLLQAGDGGAKATAKRLEKDGLATVRWNTQRIFVITAAGRAAIESGHDVQPVIHLADNPLLALDPPGCNRATVAELHRFRIDVLAPALVRVAQNVWEHEVPQEKHRAIAIAVNNGLRRGIQWLQKDIESSPAGASVWVRRLPLYWEPPVGADAHLPPDVARALRWTACDLALAVRNSLEDLHARYTADANMPTLNRALRNTCYTLLLENSAAAWRLSDIPRILIAHIDQLKIQIPSAAG